MPARSAIRHPFLLAFPLLFAAASLAGEPEPSLLGSASLPWRTNGDAVLTVEHGTFTVRTELGSPWGAGIAFRLNPRPEWERATGLRLEVSNTLARTQILQARFWHPGTDRDVKAATRNLLLPPHATVSADLPFAPRGWRLDRPLPLVGMRGTPDAGELDGPAELHVHVLNDGRPGGFALRAVRLSHAGERAKVVPARDFLPFVDAYGQFKHLDWPEKIRSHADFAARIRKEDDDLAAHPSVAIPDADRFGGWAGGGTFRATGRFRTEKVDGRWQLIDPDGHVFFSQGITCVSLDEGISPLSSRESYFDAPPSADDPAWASFYGTRQTPAAHLYYSNPSNCPFRHFSYSGANLRRKYGENWRTSASERALRRLKSWGFNTLGNWCDLSTLSQVSERLPYVVSFTTEQAPRLARSRKGYWGQFVDPTTDAFRQVVRANLRRLADAGTLEDPYLIGIFVDNELTWADADDALCETYFSVIRAQFDELAPRTLYLGCRFADGDEMGPRRAWAAAARHCHVVSANRYKPYPWLPRAADGLDCPILIGEYHIGTSARGALAPGLVAGGDDETRAEFFTRFMESALDDPRIVGCHWFQWYDQPLAGRAFDGENYQCGFVDICDTPYAALVAAARRLAGRLYSRRRP